MQPDRPPSDRYANYLRQNTVHRMNMLDEDDEEDNYGDDEGHFYRGGFSWKDQPTENDVSSSSGLLSATGRTGSVLKR
jgi:hypothetical protein